MALGTGGMDPGDVIQAVTALKDQLVDAAQQASEKLEIEKRLQENPWLVLGVAAGAGFLLGGGLWPVLRPLVKSAARTAMSPSNLLAIAAALGAMRAAQPSDDGAAAASTGTTPIPH
jgi:hypothetical protein